MLKLFMACSVYVLHVILVAIIEFKHFLFVLSALLILM